MDSLLNTCTRVFDAFQSFWHRESTHKAVSAALIHLFLATPLIRISLTTPPYFIVLIGLASVILALRLTLVYNRFYIVHSKGE